MSMNVFDDETLMAFADGELDDATAQRLEAALEHDEALAERLAVFLDTRMAIASAMQPLINEPVPEALTASVRRMAEEAEAHKADNVVAFRSRQPAAPVAVRQQWLMPIAASILAVVTGVGGFMAGRGSLEADASFETVLANALDRQPSGADTALGSATDLHVVSTFTDGGGVLCREYELKRRDETTASVACRIDGGWVTRLALSSPSGEGATGEGYEPAAAQEVIDAYLVSIEAGQPLDADAEKAMLEKAR